MMSSASDLGVADDSILLTRLGVSNASDEQEDVSIPCNMFTDPEEDKCRDLSPLKRYPISLL